MPTNLIVRIAGKETSQILLFKHAIEVNTLWELLKIYCFDRQNTILKRLGHVFGQSIFGSGLDQELNRENNVKNSARSMYSTLYHFVPLVTDTIQFYTQAPLGNCTSDGFGNKFVLYGLIL